MRIYRKYFTLYLIDVAKATPMLDYLFDPSAKADGNKVEASHDESF